MTQMILFENLSLDYWKLFIIWCAAFNSEVQHMSPKLHWAFGN